VSSIHFGMQQYHGSSLTFVTSHLYRGNIDETDFSTFERSGCCCYRGFCFAAVGGVEDSALKLLVVYYNFVILTQGCVASRCVPFCF
jgi:hypothetical protein